MTISSSKVAKRSSPSQWECIECGHVQLRWSGQCSQCHQWNTLQETQVAAEKRYQGERSLHRHQPSRPQRLCDVNPVEVERIPTGLGEMDRLLGGGLIPGALVLIGGDPGVGKSTLLLQVSAALAQQGKTVLYVCGEESVAQTSLRAKRLGLEGDRLFLLHETEFGAIQAQVEQIKPDLLIIDSIQIVYKAEVPSAPGSTTQVRENAAEYMHLAKGRHLATFLIGHVTKSGEIAGPRMLEHLVDTVVYFEGEREQQYRLLRVIKNRFGTSDEIALFTMGERGLQEVKNPSMLFLEERSEPIAGSVVTPTREGSRSMLIELQALVAETPFSTPMRRCSGLDPNRLALLLAVLEKRLAYHMFRCDVFVAIAGGLRIQEAAIDLALLLAISSSLRSKPLSPHTAVVGEVGLSGEVRPVSSIESRIKECGQMGFRRLILPKRNLRHIQKELLSSIECIGIDHAEEAIDVAFGNR